MDGRRRQGRGDQHPDPAGDQGTVAEPLVCVAANAAEGRTLGICSVTNPDKLTRIPR